MKNKIIIVAFSVLSVMSTSVLAQSARRVPVGPFDVTPSLRLDYVKDDNLYQSENSADIVSTDITTVTPAIDIVFDNGVSGFSIEYQLEDATFSDRSSEDYTDQRVDLAVGTLFAGFHRIELNAGYTESHDRRGSDAPSGAPSDIDNISQDLDEFEDTEYEVAYTLGTEEAPFSVKVYGGEFERRYTTNPATTDVFDRDESSAGVDFIWNVSEDLHLTLLYIDTDIEYLRDPDRDSSEQLYAINVDWEPTDALDTSIRVGQVEKQFESPMSSDFSGGYWDVTVDWSIYSYSSISLQASRFIDESSTSDGAFTIRRELGIAWAHNWTDVFQTELSYVDGTIDYSGDPRRDTNENARFNISYQFRRWATVGFSAQQFVRGSTTTAEYDQNVYGLNLLLTL